MEKDNHRDNTFLRNGDVSHPLKDGSQSKDELFKKQIKLLRIKNQAQELKRELLSSFSRELDEAIENFVSEVDQIDEAGQNNNNSFANVSASMEDVPPDKDKHRSNGELPDKKFVARRSVLTDLFEINHVKTIYHMFVAILIVFSLNTLVYDIVNTGRSWMNNKSERPVRHPLLHKRTIFVLPLSTATHGSPCLLFFVVFIDTYIKLCGASGDMLQSRLNLNFELIQWALGGFPKVMSLWVCMQLSTLIVVYPLFSYWVTSRKPGKLGKTDLLGLCIYIIYQTAFLIYPIYYVKEHSLPPGSVVVVMCEQLRFMMKVHAFVRENALKVLQVKKDDDQADSDTLCPDFSKYLYFLFVPTLVYRDNYPRTKTINWNYVVSNLAQVLGCLFYTYYIFERFCVPVFHNFNQEHVAPKQLLVSAFGSMLPGTLVLFLGFFGVLHSWFNAFAEMLRFADRQFYKDWWNSTSFSMYYRTWNVVVHDWLYSYVYKDFMKLLGPKNKAGAMALVFLISAVFHEYVLIVSFDFFYPVLFVMFMGAGFGFIFIKDDGSRPWNVFLWVSLFIGNGLLMCLYSMEWYARKRCPVTTDSFLDYIIPRSWTCNFEEMIDS